MLTVIAHQEDAKGYRQEVSYFNEQLLPLVGMRSVDSLDRARTRAVNAGWLHYEPGGKSKAGVYWVTIPNEHKDWADSANDEGTTQVFLRKGAEENAEVSAEENAEQNGLFRMGAEESAERNPKETRKKPETSAEHSSLYQDNQDNLSQDSSARPSTIAEFISHWNTVVGKPKVLLVEKKRLSAFRSRMSEPIFRDNWREAINKIPKSAFLRGERTEWKANIDWFLRPGSVAKILEGNYDDSDAPKLQSPETNAKLPDPTPREEAHAVFQPGKGWPRNADGSIILSRLCRYPDCPDCLPERRTEADPLTKPGVPISGSDFRPNGQFTTDEYGVYRAKGAKS